MGILEEYIISNKEELDIIRTKAILKVIPYNGYYKIKKFCFVTEIDEHGFKFNWRLANTDLISWKQYDNIIQRTSN